MVSTFRVRVTVAAGLFAGLALSPNLWLSSRLYPLTPVWPGLPPIPVPWDHVLYAALLLLLPFTATIPRLIPAFIALAAVAIFSDQSRCQPWFYQYAFLLIAAGLGRLNTCRLIVAATYFWSGMQKWNAEFIGTMFPWMVEPVSRFVPALARCGIVVPIVEIAIGIGLLTRFRRYALALALATHAFILLALGPLGHEHNPVVWPWNLAMIALVLLLFRKPVSWGVVLWDRHAVHQVTFLLFAFAPILSFCNLWDAYLSGVLYAGNRNVGTIYMTDALADRLPPAVQDYVDEGPAGIDELAISDWSFGTLNVPPYPEVRVLRNVAKSVCAYAIHPDEVTLVVRLRRGLRGGPSRAVFNCASL